MTDPKNLSIAECLPTSPGREGPIPDAALMLLMGMRVLIIDPVRFASRAAAVLERHGFLAISVLQQFPTIVNNIELAPSFGEVDAIILGITRVDLSELIHYRKLFTQRGWASAPIIVALAEGMRDPDVALHALALGAQDVLFNPTSNSEVVPRVLSALTLKQERGLRRRREDELHAELTERRVMEARLQYLVGHDDLTGLVNRRRLEQELELAILNARYHGHTGALFYLDLDQFKIINETEGHSAGDRLLVNIANKLRRQLGNMGKVARIGADEFAVLIDRIDQEDAIRVAESLRGLLDEYYFRAGNRTYHVGASVGIAIITSNEEFSASTVLAHADQACHVAKTRGRNTVHLFNREDGARSPIHSAPRWVPLIRHALAHDGFQLYYQPVLQLNTDEITHYEALIRMVGEDGQLISPIHFIPVAECMGMIHDIDLWVVDHAIETLKRVSGQIAFNVNLSSNAFQDPALLPLVRDKLRSSGVDARRITFEITETAAITNFGQTREMVEQLRALGCRFALDDFGAGFNSFSYLKQFPVDYVKIDGAFIRNLVNDPIDQQLVRAMVDIARTLGKQTVAEFVENAETLELLRTFGLDHAQGYHIGKPAPLALNCFSAATECYQA